MINYHKEYIKLQKELYQEQWRYDQLEAEIKCSIGLHAGLDRLCGWNRSMKEYRRFEKKRFQKERPGLYKKFTIYQEPTYSFIVNSWRPYSTVIEKKTAIIDTKQLFGKIKNRFAVDRK